MVFRQFKESIDGVMWTIRISRSNSYFKFPGWFDHIQGNGVLLSFPHFRPRVHMMWDQLESTGCSASSSWPGAPGGRWAAICSSVSQCGVSPSPGTAPSPLVCQLHLGKQSRHAGSPDGPHCLQHLIHPVILANPKPVKFWNLAAVSFHTCLDSLVGRALRIHLGVMGSNFMVGVLFCFFCMEQIYFDFSKNIRSYKKTSSIFGHYQKQIQVKITFWHHV